MRDFGDAPGWIDNVSRSILQMSPYRGAVKSTCKMLMELGIGSRDVYEDDFERPLLEESREFYRAS